MRVRRARGNRGTLEVTVRLRAREPLRTSPSIARRMLALLPGLAQHRCHNDQGLTFAEEIADTEVAHLLEHATIEVMVLAGWPKPIRGETAWDFERDGKRTFAVSVECDDERSCRRAVRLATSLVRSAMTGAHAPDVAREVERLRAMRRSRGFDRP